MISFTNEDEKSNEQTEKKHDVLPKIWFILISIYSHCLNSIFLITKAKRGMRKSRLILTHLWITLLNDCDCMQSFADVMSGKSVDKSSMKIQYLM